MHVATKVAVGSQHAEKKRISVTRITSHASILLVDHQQRLSCVGPPAIPQTLYALLKSGLCQSPGISLGNRCVT